MASVRADRLVALVLLLRQRGRMSARELATELDVSQRTVLRDIDALSLAGVPVYADRGRHGGFSLLPGFRTELTGLTHDEALALLTAGSTRAERVFGLGAPLASAMRKIADALPAAHLRAVGDAAARFLVDPATDLLSRPVGGEPITAGVLAALRRGVVEGRRLRLRYAAPDREPHDAVVDPVGLVTVRDRAYLLALRDGADRTYRVSRILAADLLDEPARRPAEVDLAAAWEERRSRFLADGRLRAVVAVDRDARATLLDAARAVLAEHEGPDGRAVVEVLFDDERHAVWALWQLDVAAEALEPPSLRRALAERARLLGERYARG